MSKMNPEIKAKWVAALRSGAYKQGRNALKSPGNAFCCLGVLCDLYAKEHGYGDWTSPDLWDEDGQELPGVEVCQWAEISPGQRVEIGGITAKLYMHNDGDSFMHIDEPRTFEQIADAIEAQL